jgi:integrase
MAVYDRWHKSHPRKGDQPCRCGTAKRPLYPTTEHGVGRRWQVRYRDEAGRQQKRNFDKKLGEDPETCAEAFDAKVRNELNTGTYIDPDAGKVLLEAYAKQWRSSLTVGPSSFENIDKRLAHIYDVPAGPRSRRPEGASSIGRRSIRELAKRPSLIQQWVKGLERKGLSPGYISTIADALSSIFIAAMEDGLIQRNPLKASSVSLPPVPKKRVQPWTAEQVAAARESLGGDGLMVDVAAGAGLRQGEVFGLSPDDVDWLGKDRQIRVRRQVKMIGKTLVFAPPKGDKERNVPLSSELGLRMSAHLEAHPAREVELPWKVPDGPPVTAKLFFVRADGRPHHRQTFGYRWHRARAAAGVPDTRENGFHVLRHTFASACLAAGVDVRALAEALGHDDPGFTLRTYTHLMPGAAERTRKAVDAFFKIGGPSALDVPSGQ